MANSDIGAFFPGQYSILPRPPGPNLFPSPKESDPNGKSLKEPGAKGDAGKSPVTRGALAYFPRALYAVAEVSKFGASKYSWKGWESVPDGVERYRDALGRHILYEAVEGLRDKDTGLLHAAHAAWNALAVLELMLKAGVPQRSEERT